MLNNPDAAGSNCRRRSCFWDASKIRSGRLDAYANNFQRRLFCPLESERRRLGFPTRRLPDQLAWPLAASPQSLASRQGTPSTAIRCVTGSHIPDCSGTLSLPPESEPLRARPGPSFLNQQCRIAAASPIHSRRRRGASGSSGFTPTTGAVRVRTSLERPTCPAELGQPFAVR